MVLKSMDIVTKLDTCDLDVPRRPKSKQPQCTQCRSLTSPIHEVIEESSTVFERGVHLRCSDLSRALAISK